MMMAKRKKDMREESDKKGLRHRITIYRINIETTGVYKLGLIDPRVPSLLTRHACGTVDLFYPQDLITSYDIPGIQWIYSIPGDTHGYVL